MELIIKPTEVCNFACTFCSSTEIATSKASRLEHSRIFRFLERFPETRTIIVNGGDPLMVPPEYYQAILDHLDREGLPATLSLTTNLWAFFKQPDRWTTLFSHPRVGVCTSFNYGETRRISPSRNYTEELFWKVSDLFLERIGYRPDFISVINEENFDRALENVELARRMGVVCKLNYAMASGLQQKPLVLSKIYRKYLEIEELGLTPWEFNTQQMILRMQKSPTTCPQSRGCDSSIRSIQPDGDYYSCGAFADDRDYSIDFDREMNSSVIATPLQDSLELQFLKLECLTCPLFEICNGCKKTVRDLKRHDLVQEHCTGMKALAPRIVALAERRQSEFYAFGERHPSLPQSFGHL
jgi:radical SAM protein with 4Fe4S-binding SPASM domain